jgi:hypothetical protein
MGTPSGGTGPAGLPGYLITHNPRNLPFYQRLGFEVIREARVSADGPVAWSMRRPATASRASGGRG